jgi:AsmA-like C-terminal region
VIIAKRTTWIVSFGLFAVLVLLLVIIAARIVAGRFEPYIRNQVIQYLEKRFDSDVELAELHVDWPKVSPFKLVVSRGHGIYAHVEGKGISMRYKGRRDMPPMFVMRSFDFVVEMGTLFERQKTVQSVTIDGMEINIPPKSRRPHLGLDDADRPATGVMIEEVQITNSILTILPKEEGKSPLRFDLHRVLLKSAGKDVAMKYDAALTNAKPPGEIHSTGTFGPWTTTEPGNTPVTGKYDFKDADLGVFAGIAGILHSTGQFDGSLSAINVQGEASVPDFRLKASGNPVPLTTRFTVLVDGTNGNTILKPVIARLGTTDFTTSGGIIKHERDAEHAIALAVNMTDGNLRDLLTLAMKGTTFMEGRISMETKITIPPLAGKTREKLLLDGKFHISDARFLRSRIQRQINMFSHRGQGRPDQEETVEVASGLAGTFKLADEVIKFSSLSFEVPGAGVDLTGSYNLRQENIDFHGTLKLQAKVSETMTGWKRWILKPVDPFFSRQGAGTLLHIQVTGTSQNPQFGLDRHKHKPATNEARP